VAARVSNQGIRTLAWDFAVIQCDLNHFIDSSLGDRRLCAVNRSLTIPGECIQFRYVAPKQQVKQGSNRDEGATDQTPSDYVPSP
jgi:hypothetical protein